MSAIDGLSPDEVIRLRTLHGWNEVPIKRQNPLFVFLAKFWGPTPWMIEAIIILSWSLHRRADGITALALLLLNAFISFFQEHRAEHAVELLRQKLSIISRVLREGVWQSCPARELVPGDVVRVRLGDMVPADVEILEGDLRVDQAALTGESLEISKKAPDIVYSGSIVRRGEATCKVTAIGSHTFFGRTIELMQSAHPKLHIDEIVGQMVRWLFLAVAVTLILVFVFSWLNGDLLSEVLPLSLVLLMAAVPVALPVMFSVSTSVAARDLGKKGVLITRLSAAEDAATMTTLCVDKTGTLTKGKLSVAGFFPAPGISDEELLKVAAMASNISDQDSIDNAIFEAAENAGIDSSDWVTKEYIPFSPETRRVESTVLNQGVQRAVTKGAVSVVAGWAMKDVQSQMAQEAAEKQAVKGRRSIAVADHVEGGNVRYLGIIALEDPPRSDSASLVTRLQKMGIRIRMLTGDALPIAQAIGAQIGLNQITKEIPDNLAETIKNHDGLAEIFPETKFRAIEALQSIGETVGMTGDGVNDAPSLKKAEVGIAVSSATDAAKAAASVILTTEGLEGIVDLVESGRAVYQRILTWMINKLSRTVLKVGFVVISYLLLGRFVISAMAMLLVVLMTDFAKIALSSDEVKISSRPDSWKVGPLAFMGALLGGLMIIEALILLAIGMNYFDLRSDSPSIYTFSFLLMLFMGLFSIISIRERRKFWSSKPGGWLLLALGADALVGILVAYFGLFTLPGITYKITVFVVFGAAFFSLFINDFVKVILLARIQRRSQ